ncbi:hypothetical protein ACWGKP_21480 [Brevibacillus sp. NPDC055896]
MVGYIEKQINEWIVSGVLLSLKILKQRGESMSMHGRILSYEPSLGTILLYEDDRKKVENITIYEIENMEPALR